MKPPTDNSYIGISSSRVREMADFYVRHFNYEITHDSEDFITIISPNKKRCIGLLLPDNLDAEIQLKGLSLSFLVEDVEASLDHFQQSGVEITKEISTGSWGVRHFIITDPSGVNIYISERPSKVSGLNA